MDFNLLKEFLNRDTTQKEFAKSKNAPCGVVWHKLRSEMNKLLHTEVIDAKSIICNTSRKTCDVRRNKESWLKAIKAYEKAMSNAYEKAMGEPVNTAQLGIDDVRVRSAITYAEFQEALKIVNEYKTQLEHHFKDVQKETEGISKFSKYNSETLLYETDCSVRLLNILKANEDKLGITGDWETKLKDLSGVSMSKFLQCRYAGKKALEELKELCFYAGVELSV